MERPDSLLATAQCRTRKLTPRERRAVLAYMDETNGLKESNYELAELFSVSETTIRKDRRRMLTEYAQLLTPDQALLFVSKHMRTHDRLVREAELALKSDGVERGTLAHREYLKLISDLTGRGMKMLQEIGIVAKELGSLNVVEEHWIAEVSEDGVTTLRSAADNASESTQGDHAGESAD